MRFSHDQMLGGYNGDLNILHPPEPIKLFFSYAHEDRPFQQALNKHLTPLVRAGFVTPFSDGDIHAGIEWAEEVYHHLNEADIILLLISPDFMNSDFCYHVEMTRALKRHSCEEVRVLPILLRPTYWEHTPLARLQVLPRGGKPVSTSRNRDQVFLDIVSDIFKEMKLLLSQKWLEQSNMLYDTQQHEYALNACEQALLLNPENVSASMSKGALLWHLERYEEALALYEQILLLDPGNSVAQMSKCYALWVLGRYPEALQACERVIFLDPENSLVYLLKGQLHELLRNQAYQKARQLGDGKALDFLNYRHLIMKPNIPS